VRISFIISVDFEDNIYSTVQVFQVIQWPTERYV